MTFHSPLFRLLLLAVVPSILALYADYRLPQTLEPQHYDLRILTHLNDLRFEGSVRIHLLVKEPTKNITLHAKNLRIDEERITVSSLQENCSVVRVERNDLYDFYVLHLSKELAYHEVYQLEMHFGAKLNSSESGYYNSSYPDAITKEVHNLALTQFSPTFARQAFPCFDEPLYKATFNITLGYHRNYTGLSNTAVEGCREHETLDNYVWCKHEPLLRMSTYLVAFAVHDLSLKAGTTMETSRSGITFRNWMPPELLGKELESIEMAPKLLAYFEDLFQISPPLGKVDQFIAPTHLFTAMENWGLVTFDQSQLGANPQDDLQERKNANAFTAGHEYAHMYFGNLVTMKWWNDLWLKEGPATYFSYMALDALQPELARGEMMIAKDLQAYFSKDSAGSAPAISKEIRPDQILGHFNGYVYEKGSLMIRMLSKVLGEDVFLGGIRSFLHHNKGGTVTQADLWKYMQKAALEGKVILPDFDLGKAMDSWTLQGGYPLVTLIRDYKTGSVTLNQTRFYKGKDTCWWIPLSFVRQGLPDFEKTVPRAWLECPAESKEALTLPDPPSSDEWLLLNAQVSSIFRVNYDEHNWRLISQSLQNDSNFGGIHKLNRAQLVDDVLSLASAGIRSYDWALDVLEYLRNETEFLPWRRSVKLLTDLGALLSGQEARDFKVYMQQLLSPLYSSFPKFQMIARSSPVTKDIAFQRFVYSQACHYHLGDCIEQAKELATSHQELPPDLREVVYCSYVEEGTEAEFREVLALFRNSTNSAQQQIWASVLGCSRDFGHFKKFLDFALASDERPLRACFLSAAKSALRGDYLDSQTTSYILSQAKTIGEKFKKKQLTGLLLGSVGHLQKPEELEQLKEQLKDIKAFELPLKEALDMGSINQQWQKDRSSDFIRAVRKHI